jgi:integrase/recombinase XerC
LEGQFIKYLRAEKRCSEHTIKAYRTDLAIFFAYACPDKSCTDEWPYAEINTQVIRGWASSMMESGISSRSVNRKISSLSSYFKYLMKKGLLSENPAANVPKQKVNKTLPKFVDQNKLICFMETEEYESERDSIMLEMLYCTGIRSAELINLKTEDINFGRETIKVLGKGNKERFVPMLPILADKLRVYIECRNRRFSNLENDFLFLTSKGEQLYAKHLYLTVKKQLTAAGFTGKRSPHVMRHTFATHVLNAGADLNHIKEMLGHANLAATQVYTHNTFEKLKKVHGLAHPRAEL